MLTQKELEAIKERCEKATGGAWSVRGTTVHYPETYVQTDYYECKDEEIAEVYEEEDADFIASARQDIPKLLAEIERLKNGIISAMEISLYGGGGVDDQYYVYNTLKEAIQYDEI